MVSTFSGQRSLTGVWGQERAVQWGSRQLWCEVRGLEGWPPLLEGPGPAGGAHPPLAGPPQLCSKSHESFGCLVAPKAYTVCPACPLCVQAGCRLGGRLSCGPREGWWSVLRLGGGVYLKDWPDPHLVLLATGSRGGPQTRRGRCLPRQVDRNSTGPGEQVSVPVSAEDWGVTPPQVQGSGRAGGRGGPAKA